ncbi:unnamed protein product [Sympodiomycopsis kandeliae]
MSTSRNRSISTSHPIQAKPPQDGLMLAGRNLATRTRSAWTAYGTRQQCLQHRPSSTRQYASSSPGSSSSSGSSSASSSNASAASSGHSSRTGSSANQSQQQQQQQNHQPHAKPGPATSYEKQRQREWIIIAVSGLVASGGAYFFWQRKTQKAEEPTGSAEPAMRLPSTFMITTRSPLTGERVKKPVSLISSREINRLLTANERSETVTEEPGKANLVARYDTNSVASNDPIEDRRAEAIVEASHTTASSTGQSPNTISNTRGNLAFFAVMDGHSGYHTSSYLSQKLIAFVAVELDKVFHELGEYGKIAQTKAAMPTKLWNSLFGGGGGAASSNNPGTPGLNDDPEIIKRAITRAFVGLDKEIVNTPIELLKEFELSKTSATGPESTSSSSLSTLAHSIFPAPGSSGTQAAHTATQRSAYEIMKPALSGSCALLTYIDSAQRDIYVACTGDSRAIAGWYDPKSQKWSIEPLSTDQTGRNPSEVRRMQSEHPANESDTVIMRGRVLGGLEPTRAFGDARYKWTPDLQRRLREAFISNNGEAGNVRGPPQLLQTPPYVTARPEIEWRRLPAGEGAKQLKFIVMATDGLWDMLSNEEVGSLVAGHLANIKGTVGATHLQNTFLHGKGGPLPSATQPSNPTQTTSPPQSSHGHHPLSRSAENTFTFHDSNLSTHLIRNALGGANHALLAGLMSIPAPDSRRYRDDITVNVILLNDVEQSSNNPSGMDKEEPKAKL